MTTDSNPTAADGDTELAQMQAKAERADIIIDVLDGIACRAYRMPEGSLRRQVEDAIARHEARRASQAVEPTTSETAAFDQLYDDAPRH